MPTIKEWVDQTFSWDGPKLFLELGAYDGADSRWLAAIPDVRLHVFEADPRTYPTVPIASGHVTVHKLAIAAHDGTCQLILSESLHGKPHTASSSIKMPTGAIDGLVFGRTIPVACTTLDTFAEWYRIGRVELIWSDIQGAEPDMIRGGEKTLSRTQYLFAEVPEIAEYEGQLPLEGILEILPGKWSLVRRYEHDVLLKNEGMA